jgi:threonine/homoserine/homoserine lactone efflux protein
MELTLLLQGLIIGFSIAAPVGPIGVLCIQRTLVRGRIHGFVSGLGAATADAIYGCLAGFGLTFVSGLLISRQLWIHLLGGIFLCYLGARTLLSKPKERESNTVYRGVARDYASTFLLTLTNPMTILSFVAVFAGLGLGIVGGNYLLAALFVLGIFTGSTLWWFALSWIVGAFRAKFDAKRLRWVNIVSGAIIAGFGLIILIGLAWPF